MLVEPFHELWLEQGVATEVVLVVGAGTTAEPVFHVLVVVFSQVR